MRQDGERSLTVGSLFAGIGGFDLAAEWCGHRTIWTSEIDPYCVGVLAERFPSALQLGDITAIDWARVERPDILTGGFPCQDISYAGKGAGLAGARSGLWYEYARAVRDLGPRYVVVENVRALLTRGIDAVLGTLASLGYDAEWSCYGAGDMGGPHRRDRLWILAYAIGGDAQAGRTGQREVCRDDPRSGISGHATGRGSELGNGNVGRREQSDQNIGNDCEPHAGCNKLGNAKGRGREAGRGVGVRRPDGGREGLGHAEGERPGEAGRLRSDQSTERITGQRGVMGDPERERGRSGDRQRENAGNGHTPGEALGWGDAVPVRGRDGTVRLIPREAAETGPKSPLWPVADGIPGRVARLRAIGNAIVPACAVPIFRRIAEIERARALTATVSRETDEAGAP